MSNNFKIKFNKNIYKDIDTLYFIENKDILYYDGSHLNYIYIHKIDNMEYTFYGFYKDNFFVIIFDSYDKNLSINIKNKYVILIKLNWIKKNIKDKDLYLIDIDNLKNYQTESLILTIRKKLNNLTNISIEDYLQINNYKIINIVINGKDKNKLIDKVKKFIYN